VRLLGGFIGVLFGFAVGILLVEVIFASNQSWPDVVPFALAAAGWLIGSSVARRAQPARGASRLSRTN